MSKYPGELVTTNGNQLVALTEARIVDCGVFYPITPSTEQGEYFEQSVAKGNLNAFGDAVKAVETEGEHAAQGGAIAISVTGKRVANFTSGQGIVYGLEQYYHAPGKLSTMVLNVGARALTKHALNVHCGHDDIMSTLGTGWTMLMAKDAQQAVDQTLILRKVNELTLNPGMNIQDGFLTTHLERTFKRPESELIREFLGHPSDEIDTPTEEQKKLFGPKRRRVPKMYDLENPLLLGSVQNQEHYMVGVASKRISFIDPILGVLEDVYKEYGDLTGRYYGLISEFNCENAETVFVTLGSSAENIEPCTEFIKNKHGDDIGVIHINVIRPFPEKAIIEALKGKKNVIVLERLDEPMSGSNCLARDIRTALSKAFENSIAPSYSHLPTLTAQEMPRIFEGIYGLGSRDFRPEGILGAYEFVTGKSPRQDGKMASDGESLFYIGINHPYAVISEDKPSNLPEGAISVRIHSVGGWGAITTGKNMAELLGTLSQSSEKSKEHELHISANPKYGSEKKGAPTNYFLVAAPERIKVNCELKHVDVVLCCDPKAFTHTNPLEGVRPGGAFIWESTEGDRAWNRIPKKYRQEIIEKEIRLFTLKGFEIAKSHTPREELQTRMQGNAFLGAFFNVSTFLKDYELNEKQFLHEVHKQYEKKFGKFGSAVVDANLDVMKSGFEGVTPLTIGDIQAEDTSDMAGHVLCPQFENSSKPQKLSCNTAPVFQYETYKKEFLEGDKYDQPASPLLSIGSMPAATGKNLSKYVSRIKVPVFDPYKCTQCMSCISVCPDTALPNTAQDIQSFLKNIFTFYVPEKSDRNLLLDNLGEIESKMRESINEELALKKETVEPLENLFEKVTKGLGLNLSDETMKRAQIMIKDLPVGYGKAKSIFQALEKKEAGSGGLFSIFVSDLCKGCGECVVACGSHEALKMEDETIDLRSKHLMGTSFFKTLPSTPKKYLAKFDPEDIENTRPAILYNHLMLKENYESFVSGDGSCAGCGEKSVLRGIVTMTEALMRPMYNKKSQRLLKLSDQLEENGLKALSEIKSKNSEAYEHLKLSLAHIILGFGAEQIEASKKRMAQEFKGTDEDLIKALVAVLRVDAQNHKKYQVVEGTHEGRTVMAMTASTGCNTVYGSTHPSNPHNYPWMNSLFQDGTTIGWLVGESFIMDHARSSVVPERLAHHILNIDESYTEGNYELYVHMDDAHMTDQEVLELPKVWVIGGDGALGDIGFQNLSKTVLQNRPNINILMLDTQVYSNTGGQNSDSSFMPGGFDMNQFFNIHHQGKLTERKEVAISMTSGHGSPYVASVSMASTAKFFKAVLDGLTYRGTSYLQSFTTCQPEHGVGDDMSMTQALRVRDSRVVPEFTFDPRLGELDSQALELKGNPVPKEDWATKKDKDGKPYYYTPVQWAATEARFRKHFYKIKPEEEVVSVEELLEKVDQRDITLRHFDDRNNPAYIPLRGIYADIVNDQGERKRMGVSRLLVIFSIERRRNWRRLQDRAKVK